MKSFKSTLAKVRPFFSKALDLTDGFFLLLLYPLAFLVFVLGILALTYNIFVSSEGAVALLVSGAILHFLGSSARRLRQANEIQDRLNEALQENTAAFRYIALVNSREVVHEKNQPVPTSSGNSDVRLSRNA